MRTTRGFTLLEMMFVIVVLSLLVAVAIPRFRGVRDDAEVQSCRMKLASIATAEEMFYAKRGHYSQNRNSELTPYLKNVDRLVCPKSKEPFVISSADSTYRVSCPAGHGFIDDGAASWE
jgi:general secretion pathway protein G